MSQAWLLGQRALREGARTPEALLPTLFIPLFFLAVNVGQAAEIFPSSSTDFLYGQGYGAFQLPSSLLLVGLTALWAVVFTGFMQLIAMKTRSAAATNSAGLVFFPLLFLTPNFVPRDLLTRPMEIAATLNPVTYVMEALRSLVLEDLDWGTILPGFAVVAVVGVIVIALNVRVINSYD